MIPLFTVAVPETGEVTQRWLCREQISDTCLPNAVKITPLAKGINKTKRDGFSKLVCITIHWKGLYVTI